MKNMKVITIRISSGSHRRFYVPISLELPSGLVSEYKSGFIKDVYAGAICPLQINAFSEGFAEASFIVDHMEPYEEKVLELHLREEPGEAEFESEMKLEESEKEIKIFSGKFLITSYRFLDVVKPYLYPLNAGIGLSVTEDGPQDHIHHRSLWTAHGDVNGVDIWSEEPNHGFIEHKAFLSLASGPVFAEIRAENVWTGPNGERLLDEIRTIRVWNIPSKDWLIDYTVNLRAIYGDVKLGDTKEAGILSIRVCPSLTVKGGEGRITNSFGGVNEEETWGRRAHWCDYSGKLGNEVYGVAVFDYLENFRHPTYWHVRDYGLMAANVFGISHFKRIRSPEGVYILRKGEQLTFKYRIYVHKGDAREANVAQKYLDYVCPPKITVPG